jgi:hypothetical protein
MSIEDNKAVVGRWFAEFLAPATTQRSSNDAGPR